METINVTLPASILIDLKHHDEKVPVNLAGKSVDWFAWAIAFALRQSAGDADAGNKDETAVERKRIVRAKFDKIASGEIPAGGGGGGPRKSLADQACEQIIAEMFSGEGCNAQNIKKRTKDKNMEEKLFDLTRLILSRKTGTVVTDEAVISGALEANRDYYNGLFTKREEKLKAVKDNVAKADGFVLPDGMK